MYSGQPPIEQEDIKKITDFPYSGLIIVLIIMAFIFIFFNNLIHNGSRPIEYIYHFFLYSALFTFTYGLLLSYNILQKDFVLVGIIFIVVFSVLSYKKNFSKQPLKGSYFLQNGLIVAKNGENYYEIEDLAKNYTILSDDFIKDNKAVYYLSNKIKGLNPALCKVLQFNNKPTLYITDNKNVYYTNDILDNSDPLTFNVIKYEDFYFTAKDKNYTYINKEQYVEEDNDADPILTLIKSKKEIEEEKYRKEEGRKEKEERRKTQDKIEKYNIKEKKGLVDYITEVPLKEVNIVDVVDEIEKLTETGFFILPIDRHPEKLYRLYQIYLNNNKAKAFDYLRRSSTSFTVDYSQSSSSYLARYDYAYRLLTGNGLEKNVGMALTLLEELIIIIEEVKAYDGLSSSANSEKAHLTMEIGLDVEEQVLSTKPITPMDIYYESSYLLAKVYAQGKLVPKDLIKAEKYARPFTEIYYYDQKWSVEKKIRIRRYFLMYIDIVQSPNYNGKADYSVSLFDMLEKLKRP